MLARRVPEYLHLSYLNPVYTDIDSTFQLFSTAHGNLIVVAVVTWQFKTGPFTRHHASWADEEPVLFTT